jgi:uncharacterized protein YggE
MEELGKEIHISPPEPIVKAGAAALVMLAIFLLTLTISAFKEYQFIGTGVPASNTISISGQGEVFAVPDTGEFTVTVREEAETVAFAQDEATKKINAVIGYLKGAGVEEKDIKTVSYNVNPKYEWNQAGCVSGYCPPGKQELIGFEVYQSLSVKVRDTKKAGELLSGVGSKGASEVSGLSFTIDDEDALKEEARELAIAEATEKAEMLAAELGVSLVRVVGFHEESGGGYPMPYYGRGGDMMVASMEAKAAPELPVGENKIISNVNITYEIR